MLIIDIDWNFLYLVLCRVAPLWDSVGMDIPKLSFRASIQIKQCMLSCTNPSEFIIALILDPISYQEQRLFRQRWRTWHVCWNIGMVQAWRVRGVLRVLLEEEKEHARKACCWHWHLPLMYFLHTNLIWLSIDTADNCLPLTIYQSLPCPGSTETGNRRKFFADSNCVTRVVCVGCDFQGHAKVDHWRRFLLEVWNECFKLVPVRDKQSSSLLVWAGMLLSSLPNSWGWCGRQAHLYASGLQRASGECSCCGKSMSIVVPAWMSWLDSSTSISWKDKADPTKITNTQRIDGALPTIKKAGLDDSLHERSRWQSRVGGKEA